jgi:hypothetical protein
LLGGTSIDPKTGKPVVTPSMLDQINQLYSRLTKDSGGTTGGGMYEEGAFGPGDTSGTEFNPIDPEDYFGNEYLDYLGGDAESGWGNYGE